MNQNITNLYHIAGKESRLIVGLMSGTSLDGLDVALCRFVGSGRSTTTEILCFETVPYNDETKGKIRLLFAREKVDLNLLCLLNDWLGNLHGEIVAGCLHKWGYASGDIDLIASHGQTIMHSPRSRHHIEDLPNGTLQIGDADHIAVKTGIITVSDFRQKHLAAGGEGAPLAVYGDYLLFSDEKEKRILLNIGGISNFTFLPATVSGGALMVSDTGPGNTIMDAYMQRHMNQSYDESGRFAASGTPNLSLLRALSDHSFFTLSLPRSTGPELFNLEYLNAAQSVSNTHSASSADVMATLNRFTAESIASAIGRTDGVSGAHIYISGGGWHNELLVRSLKELLSGHSISGFSELGISGDAKEAVLFAVLANEALCGSPREQYHDMVLLPVSMGKISFPQ